MFLILMKGVGILLEGKRIKWKNENIKKKESVEYMRQKSGETQENRGQVAGIRANSNCLAFGKYNLILNEKNCPV